MKTGIFQSSLRGLAVAWCLAAGGFTLAGPVPAMAQASDPGKATEQLFEAVHANDFAAVQASIAAGADVEAFDRWGMTPMELAIDKGYFEIGHYLVAVRNFSRNNTDKRPPPAAPAGSPFDTVHSGDGGAPPLGPSSPLGPLTRPADGDASAARPAPELDIQTNAGRPDTPADPAGKPNPFDPNAPVHGSAPFTIGETGPTGAKPPSGFPADGGPLTAELNGAEGASDAPGTPALPRNAPGTPPAT